MSRMAMAARRAVLLSGDLGSWPRRVRAEWVAWAWRMSVRPGGSAGWVGWVW
jgi:hypothetical protein